MCLHFVEGTEQKHRKILTRSVIGRKSLWLFAFRTTSRLVGGGIRPSLSGFISCPQILNSVCTLDERGFVVRMTA